MLVIQLIIIPINHVRYVGIFGGGKANLVNHELFAKLFLAKFTDTPKMYLAYALTVAYLPHQ